MGRVAPGRAPGRIVGAQRPSPLAPNAASALDEGFDSVPSVSTNPHPAPRFDARQALARGLGTNDVLKDPAAWLSGHRASAASFAVQRGAISAETLRALLLDPDLRVAAWAARTFRWVPGVSSQTLPETELNALLARLLIARAAPRVPNLTRAACDGALTDVLEIVAEGWWASSRRLCRRAITSMGRNADAVAVRALNNAGPEAQDAPMLTALVYDRRRGTAVRVAALRGLASLEETNVSGLLDTLERRDPAFFATAAPTVATLSAFVLREPRNHPLYHGLPAAFFDESGPIAVREFNKSGGRMILLGGRMAGRVVLKLISQVRRDAWERAVDGVEVWRKHGFDYVPVEPLLKRDEVLRQSGLGADEQASLQRVEQALLSTPSKTPMALAYAGVLWGPPLYAREALHDLLVNEEWAHSVRVPGLAAQQGVPAAGAAILRGLVELGVGHEHPHDGNFVVVRERARPRVYAIDFDEAGNEVLTARAEKVPVTTL